MKKLSSLVPVLMLLSACTSYNPDIDEAAEVRMQNRNELRAELGCQFADTHATYRDCLIATYKKQRPRTFSVTTSCDGQPVAVVSNGELKPTNPAIMHAAAVETETVVTTVPVQTPVAQPTPQPVAVPTQGNCISLPGQPCVYQQQGEVYEMQIPATPCGEEECPPLMEGPKTVTVTTTETITEKPIEVVPMPEPLPEKTWWETYQEVKPKVVCPCPDPNDPCPQCNTK